MDNGQEKRSFKDSVIEVLLIVKACITSFWFWLPVLFSIYMCLQLYLMAINPILLIVGPLVLTLFALILDQKMAKSERAVKKVKIVCSSNPLFTPPSGLFKVKAKSMWLIEERQKRSEAE